jgi:hypothetical protein
MPRNLPIISLTLLFLILATCTAMGQSSDPDFVLNSYFLDFGDVTVGDSVTWMITVTNAGVSNSLSITGVTSIVGYSITPYPPMEYPITIAPGNTQDFNVIFKPLSNAPFSGDVIFHHNASGGTTNLSVTGTGQLPDPVFSLSSNSLSFGDVKIGESRTQSISVTNNGAANTLIISGISSIAGYSITPNPPATYPILVEPGRSQTFDIIFSPTSGSTFSGNFVFVHNALGGITNLAISGTGRVPNQNFILSSSSLDFGSVSLGRSAMQPILITNTGVSDTLVVTSVTSIAGYNISPSPPVTYPILIGPGGSQNFNVLFTPTTGSTFAGHIVFAHNAPGGTTNLSVTGVGHVPDQEFVLNNTILDFGDVTIGDSVTWTISVTNAGAVDSLFITAVTSIAGYRIAPIPHTVYPIIVPPGRSQNFDVLFMPTSAGSFAGNIVFSHNAPGGATNLVVTGIGHEPDQQFVLNANALNFGDVIVGENMSQSVTVTNAGNLNALTITGVTSIGGFSVTPNPLASYPIIIAPGASQTFTITFTPSSDSLFYGNILFAHTAPGGSTALAVAGSGLLQSGTIQFGHEKVTVLDDSSALSGAYMESLDLVNYSGRPLKALQFTLVSRGKVRIHGVAKTGLFASGNWLLSTVIKRGSLLGDGTSIDSFSVVLLGLGATELVPPATVHVLTFNYDAANININKDSTTFALSGVIGSTSGTITTNAQLLTGPDEKVIIKNRVQWGDVNEDGVIDIIDLLMIVRHITGESPLTGNRFLAADVSPWLPGAPTPTLEPVPVVNVLDLTQLQYIILTGLYPDGTSLLKTEFSAIASHESIGKLSNAIHVTIRILQTGIQILLPDSFDCRGVQVELENVQAASTDVCEYSWGSSCTRKNLLKMLILNEEGKELPSGAIAELPMTIDHPSLVIIRSLKVVGNQGQLLPSESEISFKPDTQPQELPVDFVLGQNYPNPFNPSTRIDISIPHASHVCLTIFNMLGQKVTTLVDQDMTAGKHMVDWRGVDSYGREISTGTYIYRITAGNFVQTKKMMFMK